jgi:UDP-N-acetyl-alpha-D-muramoyl-L-alanyl-L-glutamate epimerase
MKLKELRKKYPEFVYESFSYRLKGKDFFISFKFKSSELEFTPSLVVKNVSLKKVDKKVLDNLVFNLGMIEMLSYWKAVCSKRIVVRAGKLDTKQLKWWKDVLIKGMGQYFYENKIDFTSPDFLEIISEGKTSFKKGKVSGKGILIPVGGGKDSAVTLELMKKFKKDVDCFALNPVSSLKEMFKVSGYRRMIVAERKIEEKLLELNRKGYLNGHTPFVAYLSFLSVLVSILFNKKFIVFSNEDSSNEGNVKWLGHEINHQYSKTYDFEKKFREYCSLYLVNGVEYFSVLRLMYEIQIARIFSYMKDYFPVFLSCNEAQKTYSGTRKKTGKWCGACSKCLFVYMVLYPFVSEEELIAIFGSDLFEKKELLSVLKELIGEKEVKPFECVGTRKEALVALYLSYKKSGSSSYLLKYFEKNVLPKRKNWEEMVVEVMDHWNKKNFIPQYFKD